MEANSYLIPNFSIEKAHAAQLKISKQVVKEDKLRKKIQYVGGVDVAYTESQSISAAVVVDYKSLSIVESKIALFNTKFPYIPTLLAFRETPPIILAINKLHLQPDIFLVNGHGIMHPYRFGLASHIGVVLNKPTVGVAKNPLIGKSGEHSKSEEWVSILDNDEIIGVKLTSKRGTKPIYVSIGHKISLLKAIEVVKNCVSQYRIPEPLRQAHIKALEAKRTISESKPH